MSIFQSTEAQIEFQEHIIASEGSSNVLEPSDIDGDGDMDVFAICIASNFDIRHIEWYENTNGLGDFILRDILLTDEERSSVIYPADLDGDGDQDLLAATLGNGTQGQNSKFFWYENLNGQGNFSPLKLIDTTSNPAWAISGSDMDGDGDLDAVATFVSDKIAWYENLDGQGDFGEAKVIAASIGKTFHMDVSDLDNDGDMDVVASYADDDEIIWYENINGLGVFEVGNIISADSPSDVHTEDMDGDGDKDVIFSSFIKGKIGWYENDDGQGNFSTQHVIALNEIGINNLDIGDLDMDGDMDALSTRSDGSINNVALFENMDGLGNFGDKQIVTNTLFLPNSPVIVDIDGDLDNDFIFKAGSSSSNMSTAYWFENLSPVNTREYTFTDFTIHPTLADNYLIIKSEKEIVSIELYNSFGKLFLTKLYPNQIDISSLARGSYFCIVKDSEDNFGIKKIIKHSK